MSFSRESNNLFNKVVNKELINPHPDAIQELVDNEASLLMPLMETVRAQRAQNLVDSPWLYQQSTWQLPATRRYQQSKQPPEAPSVQPDAGLDWVVELSRYPVPYGSIGIIKSYEQFMSAGGTIWTASEHWGNPYPSAAVRWYFRLSPISRLAAPWINASGLSAIPDYLPGTAYDDFAASNDIWFPAASPASSNIHLPIPGDFLIRLVAIVGASEEAVTISAKLAGTIQSETNDDAQFVARTSW
ncbi:MAG: hypothetical protein KAV87_17465 [Desulfobacteraceae bacterium]|nr:hypothetical protein [Desulfobacteraceae bacterium]